MHVLPSDLKRGLALVLLGSACAQPRSPGLSERQSVPAPPSSVTIAEKNSPAPSPCADRPRCTIRTAQTLDASSGAALLRAEIAPPPNPTTDEDQCRRREYWLQRPSGNLLLAADCEAQWGADSTGPAEVTLEGTKLSVSYVEYQSDDRCETLHAVIDLQTANIERQERKTGSVTSNRCKSERALKEMPPPGDGSSTRPLLVLHAN